MFSAIVYPTTEFVNAPIMPLAAGEGNQKICVRCLPPVDSPKGQSNVLRKTTDGDYFTTIFTSLRGTTITFATSRPSAAA